MRVDRGNIAKVLSSVLRTYAIEDVSVEDPPLEEVIADLFAQSSRKQDASEDAPAELTTP